MTDRSGVLLTKIIATLGPASSDAATIRRLIEEGARVFRINFSHGSFGQFGALLQHLRAAADETGVPVAALGDLSGPKLRLASVGGGGFELPTGATVALQAEPVVAEPAQGGDPFVLSTTAPHVLKDVEAGQRVLIDDGAVRMLVIEIAGGADDRRVICQVTVGGAIISAKGINLPDSDLSVPSITEHDWRCVDWAVQNELDMLALSFVRRAADVAQLKEALRQRADPGRTPIPVIAKLEKPQAIDELAPIMHQADAVMVARGDLGVEMDLAIVPVLQKRIIAMAHDYGKPVIVATQMLQSMIHNAAPTRAEVSDVANAIYDGADAVMLSGETAIGQYPVQTVATMARIATVTLDQMIADHTIVARRPKKQLDEGRYRTAAIAHGVAAVVEDLDAKLVATWSQRGGGARYLSKNRLPVPILAASDDPVALRRMSVLFGVVPVHLALPEDREAFGRRIDQVVQERRLAEAGDPIVLVAGEPLGVPGVTNCLWVRYVGDVCTLS